MALQYLLEQGRRLLEAANTYILELGAALQGQQLISVGLLNALHRRDTEYRQIREIVEHQEDRIRRFQEQVDGLQYDLISERLRLTEVQADLERRQAHWDIWLPQIMGIIPDLIGENDYAVRVLGLHHVVHAYEAPLHLNDRALQILAYAPEPWASTGHIEVSDRPDSVPMVREPAQRRHEVHPLERTRPQYDVPPSSAWQPNGLNCQPSFLDFVLFSGPDSLEEAESRDMTKRLRLPAAMEGGNPGIHHERYEDFEARVGDLVQKI